MLSKIQGKRDYELNCIWQRGHGSNRYINFVDVTKANVGKVDNSKSTEQKLSDYTPDSQGKSMDENAYWKELRIQEEIDEMNDHNREMDEMVKRYERLEEEKEKRAQIAKALEELSITTINHK